VGRQTHEFSGSLVVVHKAEMIYTESVQGNSENILGGHYGSEK